MYKLLACAKFTINFIWTHTAIVLTVFPISTPEPLVLLTPPRCLTANRTQQGVLLTWIPPANHTSPINHYIMEFRLGERWDVLDDAIPAGETELLARDLIQVNMWLMSADGTSLNARSCKGQFAYHFSDMSRESAESSYICKAAVSQSIFAYCLLAIYSSMERSVKTSCQYEGHLMEIKVVSGG